MTTFTWVAVPSGALVGDDLVGVGVVLVPRLGGGAGTTLAAHGMDRWPELLAATTLTVELHTRDGAMTSAVVQPTLPPVERMVQDWQAMFLHPDLDRARFPELLPVEHQPARKALPDIDIVPTNQEATALQTVYRRGPIGQDWSEQAAILSSSRDLRAGRSVRRRAVPATPYDFHRRVALLRETPVLLRALGLIIDAEVSVPDGLDAIRVLPALPQWPAGPAPVNDSPWTRCERIGAVVLPTPRDADGDLTVGMVRLAGAGDIAAGGGDGAWSVATFDVDAAMSRMSPVLEAGGDRAGQTDLPGLSSAGLTLLRAGRQEALQRRLGAKVPGELYAEDLVLGYRLDVRVESDGSWQPLGARTASYMIDGRTVAIDRVEEGHVKPDAMIRVDGERLIGDEQVARWDGWSLGCPRPAPGRAQQPSPTPLSWSYQPVAPLPRLRFNTKYYLRARVVDIAGGGLTPEDVPELPDASPQVTDAVRYVRVEPIPAPVLTHLEKGDVERDPYRLVIRSPGGPGTAAGDDEDARLVSPPPASVELVEQHGSFDPHFDRGESAWELARRGLEAIPTAAPVRGEEIDWLPDPMADEWILRPVDEYGAMLGVPIREPWGEWPALRPLLLRVASGPDLRWWRHDDTLAVSLPLAAQVELDLSSAPGSRDVDKLALRHWVGDALGVEVDDQILEGRQPHLTPAHRLVLVHAVQRPLLAPGVPLAISRAVGNTSATVVATGALVVDAASTAQVDIVATWSDATSTPAMAPEQTLVVASVPVPRSGVTRWPAAVHPFGDTRRRRVGYQLRAVSRFGEYFPGPDDPDRLATVGDVVELDVPSSARPPVPTIVRCTPGFRWEAVEPPERWIELQRVRRGGILRLELGPTWFHTGPGQQLAVVASSTPYPVPELRPFLSEAGRDPTRDTPAPVHFISPADVGDAATVAGVVLAEAREPVEIAALDPWHDQERGTWIADVDLGAVASASYLPFVRLAVGTYQPVAATESLRLSPLVQTELIQLLPDRTLSLAHRVLTIEAVLDGPPPTVVQADASVRVWLEMWTGGGEPGSAEFTSLTGSVAPAWERVKGAVAEGSLGQTLTLPVPDGPAACRLVACEFDPVLAPYPDELGDDLLARRVLFIEAVRLPHLI